MKSRYLMTVVFVYCLWTIGCAEGDWLGPMERGLRGALDGWDMWDTDAVRPYEDPMPELVEGTVPTLDRYSFETGKTEFKKIASDQRKNRAARAYRRYCHHCHGPNGDGRIIVGESYDLEPGDLRTDYVQSMSDQELFEHIQSGGDIMLPLAATLSPLDMFLAIDYIRTLKGRESKPAFPPQYVEPIR